MSNRISKTIVLTLFVFLFAACTHKQGSMDSTGSPTITEAETCVMSDDSLITVYWWDTGEGGSAPDIEATCQFKTESGQIKEDSRPLLNIVHPDEDYAHHEVTKIVSLDTEYGGKVYFFYLRAKVGSNEYAHDVVSLKVENDSLVPANVMHTKSTNFSHISLDLSK